MYKVAIKGKIRLSRFDLSIPYKGISTEGRNAYGILLALIMAVSALAYADFVVAILPGLPFLTNVVIQTFYKMTIDALGVCIFLPSMAGLYLLFRGNPDGSSIAITSEGLSFPGFKGIDLTRGFINWSEIASISISTNRADALTRKDNVRLLTKSGKSLLFRLQGMSLQSQEKLFLALDNFAEHSGRNANYLQYQDSLQNKLQQVDGSSYTNLWEDELRRRFTPTSFVPLKPGCAVRKNSLFIEQQLAFGGFAAVYLAKDSGGKQFVLKELALDETTLERNEKAREMFQREADLLRTIDHPQIVKVLDRFNEQGRDYLLLDYIPGNNLRQYVSTNGPLRASKVVDLALEMLSMLEYLHGLDPPIVHRDFTPDNLIWRDDGSLVLVDFGAANQFVGSMTGTMVGKQNYMPPEQIRGKAEPASDFYSLGGTLYFLITGADPTALQTLILSEQTDELPEELGNLIFNLTKMLIQERPGIKEVKETLLSMQIAKALPVMEKTRDR